MRVGDLMETQVATLEVSDKLDLADDIMRLGRIRHMPVTSESRGAGGHAYGPAQDRMSTGARR